VILYKDIQPEHLQEMYHRDQYKMDMEVCVSKYFRSRSVWDGRIIEEGSLDELAPRPDQV